MSNPKGPNYAQPSISARLPTTATDYEYSEAIKAAFVPNTFKTIKSLTGTNDEELAPFRAGTGANTTFSDFVYMCSPYDLTEDVKVTTRNDHERKMRAIGDGDPFLAGGSTQIQKFEGQPDYQPDPYEGWREAQRDQRCEEESKSLSKPFVPPGVQKALQRPTRVMLGDAMTSLYRSISEDWPEAQPTILSTAEDLIVIYFLIERVRSAAGVLTYMNNALRRNEAVLEFDLRKVVDGWNIVTEDRHLMFTLRPPWVRPRNFLPDAERSGNNQPSQEGEEDASEKQPQE